MVRGGGYTSSAGALAVGRYNPSSAGSRSTAGVRSWARARLYSKNTANPAPNYQYYYGGGRPVAATGGGAGPTSRRGRNFAISRGRYGVVQYSRAGYYRYFPRVSRGAGSWRGGAMLGGGRSQAAANVPERAGAYRATRGSAGLTAGSRGAAATGRGRGSRGGAARGGGGVRGFARGALRRGGPFRGRGRGRGAGRGGRVGAGAALNKEALDAELDKYMGEDYIKKRLDNDLERYFSRSGGGGVAVGAGAAGAGAGGPEQTAGVVGGAGSGAAVGSVVDPSAAGGAGTAAAGAAPGSDDATTNGTLKPTGGMEVSMDNSL